MVALLMALALISALPATNASGPGKDDQFGMSFDTGYGKRTGYIPGDTQGLALSYSISVSGVICTNSDAWVSVLDTVHLVKTVTTDILQAGVMYDCLSYPTTKWDVVADYYDDSGNYQGTYVIHTYPEYLYPSLSGTISIYYVNSSYWKMDTTAAGTTWHYYYHVAGGKYVNGYGDDWQNVETDPYQRGVTFGSTFGWSMTYPLFLVSGSWQDYNGFSAPHYMLYAYADKQPLKVGNTLGVEKLAAQGVEAFVGTGLTDDTLLSWQVGSAPL